MKIQIIRDLEIHIAYVGGFFALRTEKPLTFEDFAELLEDVTHPEVEIFEERCNNPEFLKEVDKFFFNPPVLLRDELKYFQKVY